MNSYDEILINSNGWQAINRLGMLSNIFYILRENYNDLIFEINSIQNLPDEQAFIKTFENKNISRMLFNFLSSASALIDYSRNASKFYKDSDLEPKYASKVKELFRENCCANFIKDFRNYQMHYAAYIPFMSKEKEIIIIIEELLKYTNWTAPSKQFLKNCNDYIGLKDICIEYFIQIEKFYNWLYSEFLKYHRNDFIETKKLINETGIPQLVTFYNSIIHNQTINLKE